MNPAQAPQIATPSMMLPPNLLRGGQTQPGQIFQQNPLSQNMSQSAMGDQPGLQPPPPPGSSAINQSMPGSPPMPQAGMQQPNGQHDSGNPQLSESQYILNVLADRLSHHSKITQKTINVLSDMITSQLPVQNEQSNAPTA